MTQEPPFQGQGARPPIFEEFMSGVRVPPTGTSTALQVQAMTAVTTNPLKTVTVP